MVIRLGQGFWVDASDGQNWTLNKDHEGLKHPEMIGYCSSLARALQMAVERGLHDAPEDTPVSELGHICERVADEVLSEVVIEKVRKKHFGLAKRFTVKSLFKPRKSPVASKATRESSEAA